MDESEDTNRPLIKYGVISLHGSNIDCYCLHLASSDAYILDDGEQENKTFSYQLDEW